MQTQGRSAGWGRLWALCAALVMALSLASAPGIEAVKHGPAAILAEADHRAYHAEQGHGHDMRSGHHDSGDHDHVSAAVLVPTGAEVIQSPPAVRLLPDGMVADGTIRDGPRRPPRGMMT
ncbi:MAG: hypothetical protein CFE34_03420 [Rhodobacteraceae bacterium PARR1]|nr:MAG: hypothetical protein CFE34_03420 [Rhodobacteraceae bacterium PARR1]